MLKIYDPSNAANVIPLPIPDDRRFVTHKYNGYDTMTFEIQGNDPLCKYVVEEAKVEDEKNRYVIKGIDEHSDFITVTCEVDVDDWKQKIFYEFRTTNKALQEVLDMIVPAGWSIVDADLFTQRTTVEGNEGEPLMAVTPLTVLDAAATAYSCVFNFNVIDKIITAIDPTAFRPSGQFFTDELNLKNLGFVGSSSGFATRLYAYGKKDENGVPMTFVDINDGKPYVEDHRYSDKVISIGWSDERYTHPESLLRDAKAKLELVSYPSRSYSCDAKNLDEDVWLYKVVTLIDRRRMTRVNHQIVEYTEYPKHSLDTITLSKTMPNITSFLDQIQSDLSSKIDDVEINAMSQIDSAVQNATDRITGNKGGSFIWIFDGEGKPIELVNLGDTTDISSAKSVWRWNASGLGHSNDGYNGAYALALLADGSVNASAITSGVLNADIIKAGILQSNDGKSFVLDLVNNTLSAEFTKLTISGKTVEQLATGEIDKLTQADWVNKITNNGVSKGIYLIDGELLVNASFIKTGELLADLIKTGTLKSKDGSVAISLDTGKFEVTTGFGTKGTLSFTIDPEETLWEVKMTTANGDVISGLFFDAESGQFLFKGSGKFTGEINVNDNFIVRENGDVEARGNTVIYGGRYFAMSEDGSGSYTEMDKEGFVIYDNEGKQLIKVGFPQYSNDYPYILLNAGDTETEESGLFKRFSDGVWLGNSVPASATGQFYPQEGYNGIFVSFTDNIAYVVTGTSMSSLYAGEAVARFG